MRINDSLGLQLSLATDYINLGNSYFQWKKYKEALLCFQKANSIYIEYGGTEKIAAVYGDLAGTYKALKNYEKSSEYYQMSLDSAKACNSIYLKANALHGLGMVAYQQMDYKKAIKLGEEALLLFIKSQRNYPVANVYLALGRDYMAIKNFQKAGINLLAADSLSRLIGSLELEKDVAFQLAKYYSSIGKSELSIDNYQKFIELNDSIFNQKSHSLLTEYQVRLNNLEKQRKVEKVVLEKKIQSERLELKNRVIWIMGISLFIFFVMSLILLRLYKEKSKSYRLLFEKNKEQFEADKEAVLCKRDLSKKTISDEVYDKILSELLTAMTESKIYLQKDISVHKMAEILDTNTSYLSKVINDNFRLNFSGFINKYRIHEAQKIILSEEYKNYTIEAIAYECGYNSKSTFNDAFKRITGLTPSNYMGIYKNL